MSTTTLSPQAPTSLQARPSVDLAALLPGSAPTPVGGRPRFDGANISTFIGFKNFMALTEEAVLDTMRAAGYGPQRLFSEHGLGLEVIDISTRLVGTMHVDDRVVGTVTPTRHKRGRGLAFSVHLQADRPGGLVPLLNGKLVLALVAEAEGTATTPVPAELANLTETLSADDEAAALPPGPDDPRQPSNGFSWRWTIPYHACHYYTRLQSNAYVRLLEDTVDRYLAHAGLPITGLLARQDWIPVVSRARVQMGHEARMGEELLITFRVEEVLKDTLFTARMDCHVERDGAMVHTASATIMHGYVLARGAGAFSDLVHLDADTQTALLTGGHA